MDLCGNEGEANPQKDQETNGRKREILCVEVPEGSKPAGRESLLLHIAGDFTPPVDLKFVENIMDVVLHRRHFDMQMRGNLLVAQPAFNESHNLQLSLRQRTRLTWDLPPHLSHLTGEGGNPRKDEGRNSR